MTCFQVLFTAGDPGDAGRMIYVFSPAGALEGAFLLFPESFIADEPRCD